MNVIVGISGGVAAYKAALLVRELMRRGHGVRVVMTRAATRFVGPVTFAGLTGEPALTDLFDPGYSGEAHVALAGWADIAVVAPATANLIARVAAGLADDALTTTLLSFAGPVVVAPAMHHQMWNQPSTQRNVARLAEDGVRFAGPVEGALASGEHGMGRMLEPVDIADVVERGASPDLGGVRIVVSAGGTREDLDPVRFLGNRSTGRMGYAIAERAARRGAEVTLVSAPTSLAVPARVRRVDVYSAREMQAAVTGQPADVVVMAAAVADYRPAEPSADKIKKSSGPLTLELVRNPDILAGLGAHREHGAPVLVGFALETRDVVKNAREKLRRKGADLIVANHADDGFGGPTNRVTLVAQDAEVALPVMDKGAVADHILDWVVERLA